LFCYDAGIFISGKSIKLCRLLGTLFLKAIEIKICMPKNSFTYKSFVTDQTKYLKNQNNSSFDKKNSSFALRLATLVQL